MNLLQSVIDNERMRKVTGAEMLTFADLKSLITMKCEEFTAHAPSTTIGNIKLIHKKTTQYFVNETNCQFQVFVPTSQKKSNNYIFCILQCFSKKYLVNVKHIYYYVLINQFIHRKVIKYDSILVIN